MNSKWSYICCGINISFAFVGALSSSFLLLSIGFIFAIWNWFSAESRRKVEEKNYGKNNEESK